MSSAGDKPEVGDTPRGPDERSSPVEQDLLEEVANLSRLVAQQERAVAEAFNEVRRAHGSLGWRTERRFDAFSNRMLRNRVLRQPYRVARRAFEIWVDDGLAFVFRFAARKIGHAIRGRSLLVEDHTWTPPDPTGYQTWVQQRTLTADAFAAMRGEIAAFRDAPLVSVLMVFDRTDARPLRRTIDSLHAQVYDRWELSLAVPTPRCAAVTQALGDQARDKRVRVVASESVRAPAETLGAAGGAVVALVNAGDALAPDALFEAVKQINADPAVDIVYSDQDTMDGAGVRVEPFFKPTWDPELLLATNFLGPFTVLRRQLIEAVGGFRSEFGAGQVYDLMLRVSEQATRIARLPKVLCHLAPRDTTRDGIVAHHAASRDERRAIEDALRRRQRAGCTEPLFSTRGPRCYTTRFQLTSRPLVSIIVPTRNQTALLRTTIESLLARTDYESYEIVVVDNDSTDADALAYLASLQPPCQVHRWPHPFNYSAINNFAVRVAKGEQLLFLNNDVEVISRDWLTAMLEYAQLPGVGVVGAKLLYTDGAIQHAGVVLHPNGMALHAFRLTPKEVLGVPRLADLPRSCSAVTGACMMVPRRVFEEVGGFDEDLRVVLNDVDLCLKMRERNYRVVYTPHALLYHHEGATRGRLHPSADQKRYVKRWSAQIAEIDPFYNPNLTDTREDWSVRLDD